MTKQASRNNSRSSLYGHTNIHVFQLGSQKRARFKTRISLFFCIITLTALVFGLFVFFYLFIKKKYVMQHFCVVCRRVRGGVLFQTSRFERNAKAKTMREVMCDGEYILFSKRIRSSLVSSRLIGASPLSLFPPPSRFMISFRYR